MQSKLSTFIHIALVVTGCQSTTTSSGRLARVVVFNGDTQVHVLVVQSDRAQYRYFRVPQHSGGTIEFAWEPNLTVGLVDGECKANSPQALGVEADQVLEIDAAGELAYLLGDEAAELINRWHAHLLGASLECDRNRPKSLPRTSLKVRTDGEFRNVREAQLKRS